MLARRTSRKGERLMEAVVARENMARALARVVQKKGAAGVDGMEVGELMPYLQGYWDGIKKELLEGKHRPQAVRKVEIPKPGGGIRMLGIPTVVDRLIQQSVGQMMTPIFDKPSPLLCWPGAPGIASEASRTQLPIMNRRIRNRTYGGVGGRLG
jgi:retron-type reverse transcriptase